ncbi:dihydrodipicolinate synthase family protein, partial [Acinetobacter baumannii]|nr:dihydrodipicolinate synthase family protein [Acinetobacter baumannii]
NTDFIIYNIPQLAGTALTLPLLRTMRKNPNVVGVKNSSMATQDIQMFKAEGGEDFVVFNGPDEQLVSGLAIGAQGGIGGTYG